MSTTKVILSTVLLWLLGSGLYAFYYVVSILNSPEPYDAYAMNWQFQLLMFSIFRLPFLVIALPFLLIGTLALSEIRRGQHVEERYPLKQPEVER